ncbi:hypothetical protein BH24ACT3_BH24ACT3_03330 [soil metagenome]
MGIWTRAFVLATTLCAGLVACSNGDDEGADGEVGELLVELADDPGLRAQVVVDDAGRDALVNAVAGIGDLLDDVDLDEAFVVAHGWDYSGCEGPVLALTRTGQALDVGGMPDDAGDCDALFQGFAVYVVERVETPGALEVGDTRLEDGAIVG